MCQVQKSLHRLVWLVFIFVLLTCIANSSSENLTHPLKSGLAMIFLSFLFSLPSVFIYFMSTFFAEVLHC